MRTVPFSESTFSGDTSLRSYMHWSHKGRNAPLLSWISSKLADRGVRHVSVSASPVSKPHHFVHKSAGVAKGRILLQGLLANTEYVLTTQALGRSRPIFVYTVHLKTGQTGESALALIYCFPLHEFRAESRGWHKLVSIDEGRGHRLRIV